MKGGGGHCTEAFESCVSETLAPISTFTANV